MKIKFAVYIQFIISILLCLSCLEPEKDEATPGTGSNTYKFQWPQIADSSVTSLNQNFWNGEKFYQNASSGDVQFNYWPQAHALDVLVDAYLRTSNSQYVGYMDEWFVGV